MNMNRYYLTILLFVACVICLAHGAPEKGREKGISKPRKETQESGREYRINVDESSPEDLDERKLVKKLYQMRKGHVTSKIRKETPDNWQGLRINVNQSSPEEIEERRLAKKLYLLRKEKESMLQKQMTENRRDRRSDADENSPEDLEDRKVAKKLRMMQKGHANVNSSSESKGGGEKAEVHGGGKNRGSKRTSSCSSDSSLDSTCCDQKKKVSATPPLKRSKSAAGSPRIASKLTDDLDTSHLRKVNSIGDKMDALKLESEKKSSHNHRTKVKRPSIPVPAMTTSFFGNSVDVQSSEGSCDEGEVTSTQPVTQQELMESFNKMDISGVNTRRPANRSGERPKRSSSAGRLAIHEDPPTERRPRSISPPRHHPLSDERVPSNLKTGPPERSGAGSTERARKTSSAERATHRKSGSTEQMEIRENSERKHRERTPTPKKSHPEEEKKDEYRRSRAEEKKRKEDKHRRDRSKNPERKESTQDLLKEYNRRCEDDRSDKQRDIPRKHRSRENIDPSKRDRAALTQKHTSKR